MGPSNHTFKIHQVGANPGPNPNNRPKMFFVTPPVRVADVGDTIEFQSDVGEVWVTIIPTEGGEPLFNQNPIKVTTTETLTVQSGADGEYTCVVYVPQAPGRDDNLADGNSPPRIII